MKILITGGCGFLGSNIANKILKNKSELFIFDNLSRKGSKKNLKWLKEQAKFKFLKGDIRNFENIVKIVKKYKPDLIYHLAGQVAMTTSILDPKLDFEVNVVGSFNILNAVRLYSPDSIIIYSSTNKVYGDLEQYSYLETNTRYKCIDKPNGFDENSNLNFHSPYGSSKGSADQYMLDFARIFNIKTAVFRHSSIYGERQFATVDQGWLSWFIQKAIEKKNKINNHFFTISGDGKQVRDLLYVSDCVDLYLKAGLNIESIKGQAFNIGGGKKNSLSLLELFRIIEKNLNIKMNFKQLPARVSDQRVFIADITKIKKILNWKPKIDKDTGIKKMIEWVKTINH
jgi:CDP-paratose 2-epimerase